ncbi:FtsX-like permease family protein [Sphingobacterium alkalisoli]|uniref:FtsX-like permease family protein n=1 Tax=Sphingobacterium alkalisoli TaxID=1874115 RepID=A0A4U0H9X2_9SPHI|nr:ABC transporter permease [Sphingobacterium alkalisoli]TJY68670.1 FtsX-like permease family protein [Sphingobacterium alkalisoli]GGH04931.1 ABC transporter permease [Sphingobacterium alkalisoli]
MIRNYIKTAWRSLLKNKGFTVINILGLTVGLSAVLIIALWVQNQFRQDNFYSNQENIYKVLNRYIVDMSTGQSTPYPAADALTENHPEVEYAARVYRHWERLLTFKSDGIKAYGNEVDPDFLKIFDFPAIKGMREDALSNKTNIVVTEGLAKSLFGDEDPLGKTITLDNEKSYTVVSVLNDLPTYTDFSFNYLIPMDRDPSNWNTMSYSTYVSLRPGVDIEVFNEKIEPMVRTHAPDLKNNVNFLYPLSRIHLYSKFENGVAVGGKISQVRLIAGIGLLILCIACINFVNLSTAKGQKRAKEVGVRKVIGASKGNLVGQFLTESVIISVVAGILAIVASFLALPLFNQMLDKPLSFVTTGPLVWLILLGFVIFTGLLAGVYPAFVLSAFQPIKTLKNIKVSKKSNFSMRSVLVVLQFGSAVVLIIATLIIHLQIQYASDRDVGYDTSQLLEVALEGKAVENYETIKNELLNSGFVTHITRTGQTITQNNSSSWGNFSWQGATPEQSKKTTFFLTNAQSDFIETVGLKLVDGRDLDYPRLPSDNRAILLNEAAIKTMGLENPIGQLFNWGDEVYTIVGVFSDFVSGSPYSEVEPMLVFSWIDNLKNMIIRTDNQQAMNKTLAFIESTVKKFDPAYPFNYRFVDERYAEKFKNQQQTASLSLTFSLLAIFISCLGLFGLISYITETRIKEIGIRKVLGASVSGIASMLSIDFVKLVFVAIIIATPIAWWAMNKWLADFAYRIDIQWWMFVLAGLLAIGIALFTVSWQAIRAAVANPVDSLRDE